MTERQKEIQKAVGYQKKKKKKEKKFKVIYETFKSAKSINFQSSLITSKLGQFRRDYFPTKSFRQLPRKPAKLKEKLLLIKNRGMYVVFLIKNKIPLVPSMDWSEADKQILICGFMLSPGSVNSA